MARVAYNTPMMAYDHIASMMKDFGGKDGLISRKDAKIMAATLRKSGRGTEALAAENLFKMIDHQDNKLGAVVTGFDIDLSRKFVKAKMLEVHDANKNGWSKDEIAKMSSTARALIELGSVLKIEKKGGRIAHATPVAGMEHVANLINFAAGPDGVTSRGDAKRLVASLQAEGRGTEALAVQYFYSFTDHRDYKPGARITADDVARSVEYSGTKLLRNKDLNNNGYSKAEYAKFSTTAKAFVIVGKMIEAGIIDCDICK